MRKDKDERIVVVDVDLTRLAAAAVATATLVALLWVCLWGNRTVEAEGPSSAARSTDSRAAAARQFYLTTYAMYEGGDALTACASGYHMASLWEVMDPSSLEYNTALGLIQADSGHGPPTGADGWIRTGNSAAASGVPGVANCSAWNSSSMTDEGTVAWLPSDWQTVPDLLVWHTGSGVSWDCETNTRVWCIED